MNDDNAWNMRQERPKPPNRLKLIQFPDIALSEWPAAVAAWPTQEELHAWDQMMARLAATEACRAAGRRTIAEIIQPRPMLGGHGTARDLEDALGCLPGAIRPL